MGRRRYELDTRVLTVFFLVAMPFGAFGSFVVVSVARGALRDAVGESLEQRAAQTRLLIERYVGDQIVHLRLLALDPQIQQALRDSSRGGSERGVGPASRSALASRLHATARVRPGVTLVQVVDTKGRLVATSGRDGQERHKESAWFRALARDELPRPFVGGIRLPKGSSLGVFEVAYPVYDAQGFWLGGLHVLVDAADLYSVLAPVRVGRTGRAVLIRSTDGLVLASDDTKVELVHTFPGFSAIGAAIRERRGYWVIPEIVGKSGTDASRVEPARIVGYSLVEQIPGLEWVIVVEQELQEATEPVSQVTRYLWIHFIGAFGTVILLALYFSFKLEAPVIEEGLHLHAEHVPKGARPASEE